MRVRKETPRHLGKRALALFLSLVMCMSMLQISAFADATYDSNQQIVTKTEGEEPNQVTKPVYYTYTGSGFDTANGDTQPVVSNTGDDNWKVQQSKQISGTTEEVMALEDFAAKWSAFGWDVTEIDGNDMQALCDYFDNMQNSGKPHCLILHTIKGKGLPFAENRAEWHHHVPTEEQLAEAYEALGVKAMSLS